MTFIDILFIIVIIFALIAAALYYFKRQGDNAIQELEDRKDNVMNVSVADQLYTLKNMELSGQTKRKYESLNSEWQTLNNFKFPEIESALVSAKQYNESLNIVKSRAMLDDVEAFLDSAEEQIATLNDEIEELSQMSEDNRKANEKLLERYNTVRKTIMNHSFDYGPAIETLEKNAQYLELNFTRYNELTTNGDYIEAEDMLKTIEADLLSLEEILEKIPKMYNTIKNDYEASIEDLRQGYKKMLDAEFKFKNDTVMEDIDQVQEQLSQAKQAIKGADLADAKTLMDKAEREIDSLYDYMEAEIEAKNYVVKHLNQLRIRLQEVIENNRYASIEVDRISQSYILHNNQVETIASYVQALKEEEEKLNQMEAVVENNEAIYTDLANEIDKMVKRIDEIDDKQKNMIKDLMHLTQQEKESKQNLDLYELDMRNLKRRIEKQHLPGLLESYYEMFYKVTDQIERLSQALNQVRIDMKEIRNYEERLTENLNQLEELTDETIDSAALTEYMIQHANRYRYDHETVNEAIHESEFLFYEQYRYVEALNVIEKALYRVDQAAPSQVRRMYHQEKQARIF